MKEGKQRIAQAVGAYMSPLLSVIVAKHVARPFLQNLVPPRISNDVLGQLQREGSERRVQGASGCRQPPPRQVHRESHVVAQRLSSTPRGELRTHVYESDRTDFSLWRWATAAVQKDENRHVGSRFCREGVLQLLLLFSLLPWKHKRLTVDQGRPLGTASSALSLENERISTRLSSPVPGLAGGTFASCVLRQGANRCCLSGQNPPAPRHRLGHLPYPRKRTTYSVLKPLFLFLQVHRDLKPGSILLANPEGDQGAATTSTTTPPAKVTTSPPNVTSITMQEIRGNMNVTTTTTTTITTVVTTTPVVAPARVSSGSLKITDFGKARSVREGPVKSAWVKSEFSAPEMLMREAHGPVRGSDLFLDGSRGKGANRRRFCRRLNTDWFEA